MSKVHNELIDNQIILKTIVLEEKIIIKDDTEEKLNNLMKEFNVNNKIKQITNKVNSLMEDHIKDTLFNKYCKELFNNNVDINVNGINLEIKVNIDEKQADDSEDTFELI